MRTKMNLDVIAETEEEKKIEEFINLLHSSNEIQSFLNLMEKEAKKRNVFKYRARIKNVNSAIRTYRINKKTLDEAHDYVGISFITNTESEIYPIVDYLKSQLLNIECIDFVAEEYIYSPLVYIKWVPPLGYNIFAKESLIPNQREIPIEIRVCSKEAFISEQSAYYSVQKNDTIKMPIEQKNNLRNIVQHITYKLALLSLRNLTEEDRTKHTDELNKLLDRNKSFLKENEDLCKDAILDFGRLTYRLEHEEEINKNEKELSKSDIDNIDERIKERFNTLIEEQKGDSIKSVCTAVQEMKKINYKDFEM